MRIVLFAVVVSFAAACGPLPLPGTKCDPRTSGGPFCVPDAGAPAGQPLTLEIYDQCSGGCGADLNLKCKVARDAGTITLSLAGEVCRPLSGGACPAICVATRFTCDVPALPEGTYVVVSADQSDRILTVGDGGTTTCAASPF